MKFKLCVLLCFICIGIVSALPPLAYSNTYTGNIHIEKIYADIDLNMSMIEVKYELFSESDETRSVEISFRDIGNISGILLDGDEVFLGSNGKLKINFVPFGRKNLEIKYRKLINNNGFVSLNPVIFFDDLRIKYNVGEIIVNFVFSNEEFEIINSNLKYNSTNIGDFVWVSFFSRDSDFHGVFFQIKSLSRIIFDDTFGSSIDEGLNEDSKQEFFSGNDNFLIGNLSILILVGIVIFIFIIVFWLLKRKIDSESIPGQ